MERILLTHDNNNADGMVVCRCVPKGKGGVREERRRGPKEGKGAAEGAIEAEGQGVESVTVPQQSSEQRRFSKHY